MSNYQNDQIKHFADVFKALSNPNRLRMFLHLATCCVPGTVGSFDAEAGVSACVGDLGRDLQIVPSTVSHHIKELHRAGLIRMERRGQKIECWVDPVILQDLARFFEEFLAK
jgi:ArsR family transcriptional regulator